MTNPDCVSAVCDHADELIQLTDRVIAQQLAPLFRRMHNNEGSVRCPLQRYRHRLRTPVRGVDERVKVSDAWLVDRPGHIQAWAWLVQYAYNGMLARGGYVHWSNSNTEPAAKDKPPPLPPPGEHVGPAIRDRASRLLATNSGCCLWKCCQWIPGPRLRTARLCSAR
jgi:hypothetical protein